MTICIQHRLINEICLRIQSIRCHIRVLFFFFQIHLFFPIQYLFMLLKNLYSINLGNFSIYLLKLDGCNFFTTNIFFNFFFKLLNHQFSCVESLFFNLTFLSQKLAVFGLHLLQNNEYHYVDNKDCVFYTQALY